MLTKRGAIITHTWNDLSPLHLAACVFGRGCANLVDLLLDCGADPMQSIQYEQFIRLKQLQMTPTNKKVRRQFNSERSRLNPEELKSLNGKLIYPIDIGAACKNRDVVVTFISRLKIFFVFDF